MSGTLQIRSMMLADLHHVINSVMRLLDKIQMEDWDYRLSPEMRTLGETAQHLVAVPGADLLIMQEKGQEEVSAYEKGMADVQDMEKLKDRMVKGFRDLNYYMESLSVHAFLNETTKAFYADAGVTQARWLLEVITHVYHHRAQMFTYMRAKGYDVSMDDLYL